MKRYLKTAAMAVAMLAPMYIFTSYAETVAPEDVKQAEQLQKVNVNTASAAELQLLKGIGEAKAKAIVEYRETNGKFASLEDLTKVKGIGPKFIEKNGHLLSL